MNDSGASFVAILFAVGIFLVIVAIGWRSVQHRRILRMQDATGHETIVIASEDDEISSIVTTTEAPQPASEPAASEMTQEQANPSLARSEFRRSVGKTAI